MNTEQILLFQDEGEDCCYAMEKESNGSEKKLLKPASAAGGANTSNSNSDSEYTYVDGRTARTIPVKQVDFASLLSLIKDFYSVTQLQLV